MAVKRNTNILLLLFSYLFCVIMMATITTEQFSYNYAISSGNRCRNDGGRFGFFQGYSITDCVEECARRTHCEALTYAGNINVCELYLSHGSEESYRDGHCLYVKRSDIRNITIPCEECYYGQVCDTITKTCRYKECINVTIPINGTVLGNMRGLNDVIRYVCDEGFRNRNGVTAARCLDNGMWSGAGECARVCIEPEVDGAYITAGDTIEGSVRNVTCGQNTIDDKNASFQIKCMADGSWTPDIICLKNVIFRVVTGNGLRTSSAWQNGTGTTADVHCRVISTNPSCNGHYRDPRIDKWDTLNGQTVRYSIYKNFEEVAWIDFNGTGSSNTNWFEQSRIINSSYQDMSSSSTFNFLQIDSNIGTNKRRFYASVYFGGCYGDILYFVTVDSEGVCWYDQKIPFPSITYSKTQTMANTGDKENFDFGDTAVVSLK